MARCLYGYKRNGKGQIVPCEPEQQILRFMKELREKGYSYRDMAKILADNKIKTRTGRNWHFQRIEAISKHTGLLAPIYFMPSNIVREYLSVFTKDDTNILINKLVEQHMERRLNDK